MRITQIIAALAEEIERLQQAKALLTDDTGSAMRGRKASTAAPSRTTPRKRRELSPEARARIAEAQKRRWANAKKTANV